MRRGSPDRTAWVGFLLAAALTVAGWSFQTLRDAPPADGQRSRMMVVGVRSMSWPTLLELDDAEEIPHFRALVESSASGADIVSAGYRDPGEVLASVITGKFPHKHNIHSFADAARFRQDGGLTPVPVWDLLNRRGRPVGVVGFPFWSPMEREGSWVVPDWSTFSAELRVWKDGRDVGMPPQWERRFVRPEEVPVELLQRVTSGRSLSPTLVSVLRHCLAADLTMIAIACEIYRDSPDGHVFLYLEGLSQWEERAGDLQPAQAPSLVAGYHGIVDLLLARMAALDDGATTFVLFSEEDDHGGALTHRPGFPDLERSPPVGWLIAWGRGIRQGVEPLTVAPVDLAATLLYVAGSPVPNDMDGTIEFRLLHEEFFHQHRVAFEPGS